MEKVSIGFAELLALIFITLKLTGVITWSWWWVTFPLWGPIALFLGIAFIALAIHAIVLFLVGCAKAGEGK